MKITVLTKIPSPYQVELFNALAATRNDLQLSVVYLRERDADRSWSSRRLEHAATFLDTGSFEAGAMDDSDLVIFSWYRDPVVRALIRRRVRSGRPWAYWGERPGFRIKGVVGQFYRRWRLWHLWRDTRVSIWGIGHWAIEGYRSEFGTRRAYFHVPYVSNLSPFFEIRSPSASAQKTILYSGSLIERKGVRELCDAFELLSTRRGDVRLRILGGGPLEAELRGRFGSNQAVTFLGFQDWDGLARHYAEADVLCAPSRHDGWGLIVPEAMAAGIPVVASTAVGSAREMVVEGETGWLVPPRDANALAAAMDLALSQDPGRLARIRELCREKARGYSVASGVDRFAGAAHDSLQRWVAPRLSLAS